MTLNLHLQIIYLLRNAEQGKGCSNGARDAEKDYVEGMFGQAVYGTLSAIGAGAAAQIRADQIAAEKKAADEKREAERKALEESMLGRKEDATASIEVVAGERYDSSYHGEKVEQPKTTVITLKEVADEAYHKYALELKRMDQDMVPMTKEEFMKQNYPSLYSQTHQPAQVPHSVADFTKEQAKERLSQGQGSMPDAQWRQLVLRATGPIPDMTDKVHDMAQSASGITDPLNNGYGKVTDGLTYQSFTPDGKNFLNKLGLPGRILNLGNVALKEVEILTSDSQNKPSEMAHLAARTVGGMVGAGLGTIGGAAVGAAAGFVAGLPGGAGAIATLTLGGVGGGLVGGSYGGDVGENVGNKIADFFFGKLPEERIK